MKYTFTVTETCEVTFELSTDPHNGSGWKANMLSLSGYCADAYTTLESVDSRSTRSITVSSDQMPLTKQISYKVLPGSYYIRASQNSAWNAFGYVEFKSVTPIEDDWKIQKDLARLCCHFRYPVNCSKPQL